MDHRPSLDPAVAQTRSAVRAALAEVRPGAVVVGLSGGGDSLALAAATAFEAPKQGMTPVSVTIDHGLQPDSAEVAEAAARQAEQLGIDALVERVRVGGPDGPEAAARAARYAALARVAREADAAAVLVAHTLDDQAETVLLGLARGSGPASLQGMAASTELAGTRLLRPFLHTTRAVTHAACRAQGLRPWHDPQNDDPRFARVRVRRTVLPLLEAELGPGIARALARTAEQLREDADALAAMAEETARTAVERTATDVSVPVAVLAAGPAALRQRVIRCIVADRFGQSLSRTQTLRVARLVTDWSGQGPLDLPGCRARRTADRITFSAVPGPS